MAIENGVIYLLAHIPIDRTSTLLQLYKLKPSPIEVNQTEMQLIIEPQQNFLSVNADETLYSTYDKDEIEHKCTSINDIFHCKEHNVPSEYNNKNCLISPYNKNKE